MRTILFIIFIALSNQLFSQVNMEIKTEQVAHYPAGDQEFFMLINKKLKYSDEAIMDKVDVKLMLTFDVETDSTISNIVFLNQAGYGIEKDIENIIKPLKFAPKIMNGRTFKSNVMYTIPVFAR